MKIAIVDIETAPDHAAVQRVTPPFDPESVKCGNLKDPEKIAEKKREAESDYWQAAREKAALRPETSRIVAIGIHFPHEQPLLWADDDEAKLLTRFWRDWATCTHAFAFYSGNNGRGAFDVRHLLVRSWANRLTIPEDALDLSVRGRWIDLAERFLVGADSNSYFGANAAAKALGLIGLDLGWAIVRDKETLAMKPPEVHAWFASPDPAKREAAFDYLRNDLALERALADVIHGKAVAA